MSKKTRSNLMLVMTALIWGSAFVAQSVGMDYIGPFTFNAVRSFLGGTVLIPVIWLLGRRTGKVSGTNEGPEKKGSSKRLIIGGSAAVQLWRRAVLFSRWGLFIPVPGRLVLSRLCIS